MSAIHEKQNIDSKKTLKNDFAKMMSAEEKIEHIGLKQEFEKSIEKKESFSLENLLQLMDDFDDGISNLSVEDMKEIVGEIVPEKVDGCKRFIMSVESRMIVVDNEIKHLQGIKKSMGSSLENFRKYVANTLENSGTSKLPGNKYILSLGKRKNLKALDFDVTSTEYMNFNMQRDNVVKREYKLNSKEFKKLCEENETVKNKYSEETISTFAQFRLNKGIK